MWRLDVPLAALILATAGPAEAASLSDVGKTFCGARLTGALEPAIALFSDQLAALLESAAADGATALGWGGQSEAPLQCMVAGAGGTRDTPEAVLVYQFASGAKRQYSERLVLKFFGEELRIDDVKFPDGTTLRQQLGETPVR